ncbi:cell division inhibitor SulA [Citrobacter sp. JGM124]|nr:cell division inhibitor SulA [Citrobacter sp. JGM124]
MHSHDFPAFFAPSATAVPFAEKQPAFNNMPGLISEIVYREDELWVAHCILLPLLQQLGHQSRWQLWLTPQQKLSRQWLQSAGLPLNKVMQSRQSTAHCTISAMEKALLTGNYSVVISWLDEDLTEEQHRRLTRAAESGNALGFIMRPQHISATRPQSGLKIHSSLYH